MLGEPVSAGLATAKNGRRMNKERMLAVYILESVKVERE